ncbi:MAG: DMT family transporter [Vicinamibacterales bacterium]
MRRPALDPSHLAALRYVVPCVTCWALIPNFAAQLPGGLGPARYLFWSNVVSTIVLVVTTGLKGRLAPLLRCGPRDLAAMAGLGVLGACAYYALLYSAYDGADRDVVPALIVVQYTWPVLTAALSVLALHEPLGRRATAGLLLSVLAVGVACGSARYPGAGRLALTGVAALTFAGYSVLARTRRFEPFSYVTVVFAAGALGAAAWMWWVRAIGVPGSPQAWAVVLLNGAVANGLSYVWWQRALALAPASFVAPWVCATPLLSTSIYWAVFGHPVSTLHWTGVAMVLLAMWLTTVTGEPRAGEDAGGDPPASAPALVLDVPSPRG